jgi:DNA invertase Pin-like site-specific DNA recombinase
MAQMNGARVEYAQPGRDKPTIEGYIQHSAEEMVSGIERLNIARRTKEGRRAWARKGRVIASSNRPFGYTFESEYDERGRKTDCRLAIVADEAAIVRQMFEWCALDGMTSNGITRRLTADAVPTLTDKKNMARSTRPTGQWRAGTVRGILRNPAYNGEWYYGKRKIERLDTVEGVKS